VTAIEERLQDARASRTASADAWLTELLADAEGVALVAVGGYGRGELGAGSDLDVLMLHDGRPDIAAVADKVWYPIWDSGTKLDHSVRTLKEAVADARDDMKAAHGFMYARHVAGDADLTARLRQQCFNDWRARASRRLPALREMVRERAERFGDVAFLLEPDLKEAGGGLRDVHAMQAVAASWIAAGPGPGAKAGYRRLLDVRDVLQDIAGRATTRLVAQEQSGVADALGISDADELLRVVSQSARAISYASDMTWRSVEGALRRRPKAARKPLADGIVEHDGEATLARGVDPSSDPLLALRAAAAAAQAGLPMAPPTVDLLAAKAPALPTPWPAPARDSLVSLLGAGRPAVVVFEALDQCGLLSRLIPEWQTVRFRRQRNPIHRFTVDRHLIEAAVEAAAFTRQVARPDLLLLAAFLHDIGKGSFGDHSEAGARIVPEIARNIGMTDRDAATLVDLVRLHLLLPQTATRRDIDDPATIALVADAVRTPQTLELLRFLAEADARATGPGVWDEWKAGLIDALVERVAKVLAGDEIPLPDDELPAHVLDIARHGQLAVIAEATGEASRVTIIAPDQPGLLWRSAGVLALHRLAIRAATARSVGAAAVTVFDVHPTYLADVDTGRLREDLRRALGGGLDLAERLARRAASARKLPTAPARVLLPPSASTTATVIEVRAHDQPGLLFTVARTLDDHGLDIRAARIETLGAEVVDAFYVTDRLARPLSPGRAEELRLAVAAALRPPPA
jgi:[protein-PII] uridylyltransferase